MEISQIKKSMQEFVKNVEVFVEKNLGDRSQLEEQVRGFAKQIERTVSEVVKSRGGPTGQFEKVILKVNRLENFKGDLPKYESPWASGFDVRAQVDEPVTLQPGQRTLIPTGLSFEIPLGYEIQVRARSGLAIKRGLGLVNAPGTIDADYRGEVKVIVINWGQEPIVIQNDERIAQFVVCPVVQAEIEDAAELSETERGDGGFGSTGGHS